MRTRIEVLLVAVLLSSVGFANLAVDGSGIVMVMWGETGTENNGMSTTAPTYDPIDESYSLSETWSLANNCEIIFDLVYKPDPYVVGGFTVTNTAAFTQSFMFSFTSPVIPVITTSTYYGGSMSASYTIDGNGGTVSTITGMPLYMGMIDEVTYLTFYPDPQSWTAAPGFSGDIPMVGSPLTNIGPVASDHIEFKISLTLTPGETATMNGNFAIIPIPEPATLSILGVGAMLLGIRRK